MKRKPHIYFDTAIRKYACTGDKVKIRTVHYKGFPPLEYRVLVGYTLYGNTVEEAYNRWKSA